jgi:hypothetical protein
MLSGKSKSVKFKSTTNINLFFDGLKSCKNCGNKSKGEYIVNPNDRMRQSFYCTNCIKKYELKDESKYRSFMRSSSI